MELLLLGTGAAEGIPAFYCECRVCRHAHEQGGKEMRTRSGALLDGHIKIDLPPDTLSHLHRHRRGAQDWSALVFTHSDDDHFAIEQLQYGLYPFSGMDHLSFTIYANAAVLDAIRARYPDWPMDLELIKSFCPFEHAGYGITPIKAKHMGGSEDALNLIFQRDGKTLLYGTDTGVWDPPTWEFLQGLAADTLVIECTQGLVQSEYDGHLDVKSCLMVVERLKREGGIKEDAIVVTTHHSHNGDATHVELESALNELGVQVGFDGMRIQVG